VIKVLRLLFCAGALALLFTSVDRSSLLTIVQRASGIHIAYLALITVALIYCSVLKWRLFLGEYEYCPTVAQLFRLYVVGYFVNSFLPSSLGGDAHRSWQVGKSTGQTEAFAATFLERYTGFVAMLILGVIMMWFSPLVPLNTRAALLAVAMITFGVSIFAFSSALLSVLASLPVPAKILKIAQRLHQALHVAMGNPLLVAKAMALSFTFHSLTIINTLAACWVVGWFGAPTAELFVVVPLILLIGAIPLTPSGIGIQEGAFYFFLHALGASPEQALGVGLVLRAKTLVLAACGGGLWLVGRGAASSSIESA
jgi:glycosyltransferase 2 family protein